MSKPISSKPSGGSEWLGHRGECAPEPGTWMLVKRPLDGRNPVGADIDVVVGEGHHRRIGGQNALIARIREPWLGSKTYFTRRERLSRDAATPFVSSVELLSTTMTSYSTPRLGEQRVERISQLVGAVIGADDDRDFPGAFAHTPRQARHFA